MYPLYVYTFTVAEYWIDPENQIKCRSIGDKVVITHGYLVEIDFREEEKHETIEKRITTDNGSIENRC